MHVTFLTGVQLRDKFRHRLRRVSPTRHLPWVHWRRRKVPHRCESAQGWRHFVGTLRMAITETRVSVLSTVYSVLALSSTATNTPRPSRTTSLIVVRASDNPRGSKQWSMLQSSFFRRHKRFPSQSQQCCKSNVVTVPAGWKLGSYCRLSLLFPQKQGPFGYSQQTHVRLRPTAKWYCFDFIFHAGIGRIAADASYNGKNI